MSYIVSKTDYIIFRECPKNAWIKIHQPKIYYSSKLSDFEKLIIETGNEVELVARKLFPTGILIEGRGEEAQKTAQDLISEQRPTLFQPIFVKDGFLAALDILKFNPATGSYSIYEVKAVNDIDDKVHFHDLAFQFNLLKKVGLDVREAFIIHLNPEYVRSGDLDVAQLFKIVDVTKEIDGLLDSVAAEMNEALAYLSQDDEPKGSCCCIYKGRSRHCTTFRYSNPQVPEYGVHDIARIGSSKAKLEEMIDRSIFDIREIPAHIKLTEIQQNQVDAYVNDQSLMKKSEIAAELCKLVFPIYFVDYETFPSAIPRFDGFSSYQQIPFEYSLHILKTPTGQLEHKEFLHVEANDPSLDFVADLEKNIGTVGTIVVWSKRFESKINEQLAERLPESKIFVASMNGRIYDLMDIFSKQYYVHKSFQGSTSIKHVLPALVPGISYDDLEIHEGGMAAEAWNKIVSGLFNTDDAQKMANNLRKYCSQDTYAMYAIWKHLHDLTIGVA